MAILDNITFYLSEAVVANGVFTERFSGRIVAETEKAVRILPDGANDETLWLPKKALVKKRMRPEATGGSEEYSLELAPWFRPSSYQNYLFNKYSHVSGLCA